MAPGIRTVYSQDDSPLIAPDLALERLHLIVPDESDAMIVLSTLANGASAEHDPRTVFAERLAELGHLTVSFGDEDPPLIQIDLPDLTLNCVPQDGEGEGRLHTALRVVSIRPVHDHPDGAKVLTITAREPIVTPANGVESDTHRARLNDESGRRSGLGSQAIEIRL